MSRKLEDYGLVGDGRTAALIARDGSVDWLCWPRFDSDACFAALLGNRENGCWMLAPRQEARCVTRQYQPDTLVLETELETATGAIRIIDFMPRRDDASSLVRIVVGLRGRVVVEGAIALRFDYGSLPPGIAVEADGFVAECGPDRIELRGATGIALADNIARFSVEVAEGDRLPFCLTHTSAWAGAPPPIDPEAALSDCAGEWRSWIHRFDNSRTRWPQEVRRSLITLRAMIHRDSGGLVAAPTTSLPELPGGDMNWDYRFAWLRDSTFTVGALLEAGFETEATAWRDWLVRAIAGAPARMRIMYRVDGARHLSEWNVDTLPGYRHAKPVRVGNAASTQHQIDVYGEVLDCLALARRGGLPAHPREREMQLSIADHLEAVWSTPGSGVWESRSEPRHYTYSKVMAWVGLDRVERMLRDAPDAENHTVRIGRMVALKQRIHDEVCAEGWNEGLDTFTQHYGSEEIDASLLLLPLVGFLPADDPRIVATVETIRRELTEDGLVRRKKRPPGGASEGAFLACSCWMADCLQLMGRHDEAVAQFERVLAVANDLGLLSEEYNVPASHLAGNFPQALTHLAVVNTALGLCGPVLHRGGG